MFLNREVLIRLFIKLDGATQRCYLFNKKKKRMRQKREQHRRKQIELNARSIFPFTLYDLPRFLLILLFVSFLFGIFRVQTKSAYVCARLTWSGLVMFSLYPVFFFRFFFCGRSVQKIERQGSSEKMVFPMTSIANCVCEWLRPLTVFPQRMCFARTIHFVRSVRFKPSNKCTTTQDKCFACGCNLQVW